MEAHTRRNVLKLGGAAAFGISGVTTIVTADTDTDTDTDEWSIAESPTTKTLNGVVETAAGPFAVGAGGDVLARRSDGWERVVDYGPQARSRPLTGVDVTDDGSAIWFVGGSGVIGEYNVVTETLTNYSAPKGKTSTWEDCAVTGSAGQDERLYFVNGSGELLVGVRQESGAVKYNEVTKPGGGSTIPGIDFHAAETGRVCSTSQLVAETSDGGAEWSQVGIDFAGESFSDVASVADEDVNVAAGSGVIYRFDGFRWTPHVVDDNRKTIRSIDRDGEQGLAAGDGGAVFARESAGQWTRFQTPSESKLLGASWGSTGVDVAVGAGGTIVERVREETSTDGGETTDTTNTTDFTTTTGTTELTSSSGGPAVRGSYEEGEWVFDVL